MTSAPFRSAFVFEAVDPAHGWSGAGQWLNLLERRRESSALELEIAAEADIRASELNRELGASLESRAYYVPIKLEDGEWEVERRQSKRSLLDLILGAVP